MMTTPTAGHGSGSPSRVSYEPSGTSVIEPDLLEQELRSGRALVIVDVRSPAEFCRCHIKSSWLVPIEELEANTCELSTHRFDPIVLVSNDGVRARLAARMLRLAGFDEVSVVDGGLRGWRDRGYPIEETSA